MNWDKIVSIETLVTTTGGDVYSGKMEKTGKKKVQLVITFVPVADGGWINKLVIDTQTTVSLSLDEKENVLVTMIDGNGDVNVVTYNKDGNLINRKPKGKDGQSQSKYSWERDMDRVLKLF